MAGGIMNRGFDGFKQFAVVVVGVGDPLLVDGGSASGDGILVMGAEKLGQFPVKEIIVRAADEFGFRLTDKMFKTAVAAEIGPVWILHPYHGRHGLQQVM